MLCEYIIIVKIVNIYFLSRTALQVYTRELFHPHDSLEGKLRC